jgi:hypothetical protein
MTNVHDIFVGKPEDMRSFGKRRRESNVRMNLREIGWEGVNWMDTYGSG